MILQILITLFKKYSNITNFYVISKINNTDSTFTTLISGILCFWNLNTTTIALSITKIATYVMAIVNITTQTINAIIMISQNITFTVTTNNNDIITTLHLSFQYHNYRLVSRAMLFPHTSIIRCHQSQLHHQITKH